MDGYPFVSMLVTVVPRATVTESVVVCILVHTFVLLFEVVALGLAPMLVVVEIPFVVIATLAHCVFANVTFAVVGSFVNVSASVLFHGIVSAV